MVDDPVYPSCGSLISDSTEWRGLWLQRRLVKKLLVVRHANTSQPKPPARGSQEYKVAGNGGGVYGPLSQAPREMLQLCQEHPSCYIHLFRVP